MQSEPYQRLTKFKKQSGLTLEEIATRLGVSNQSVHKWMVGKVPLSRRNAQALETHFGVSCEWLLDGANDMLSNKSDNSNTHSTYATKSGAHALGEDLGKTEDRQITVPLLSAHPCAGHENWLDDHVGEAGGLAFGEAWLRYTFGVNPQNLCLVRVDGDSMSPTLGPGDLVFVDGLRGPPEYRDGVWVLNMRGHLFVKRVQLLGSGRYRVYSDNQRYEPMEMDGPAQLLGRVVGGPPARF